ncbi:MAG TPA: hypothetical protein VLB86_06795 [Gaiellaceae bacterium]|nr:hypothetical protein [Gaiellaceae bacterium]
MAAPTRQTLRRALARLEDLASRPGGALVLLVLGVLAYAVQALAWPLTTGRDLDEYLYFWIQLFDRDTLLPWSMLFRTPGTPVVVGPLLDLWGGALAEPVAALLYAGSIVAWSAAALAFGARAALATAVALLLYPGYALMFHELGSELVMAAAFAGTALLFVRASARPTVARFAAVGLAAAFVILVRPGNVVLLALALFPLALAAAWRQRLAWAGAFAAAALVPLAAWTVHNGLRYDHWSLARGGNAVIPFYRVFLFDKIVAADNGPESERLADAIEEHLLTREPYRSYGVTLDEIFSAGSARVHEDLYTLSDQVFGWDTDYRVLRDAGTEAVEAHPGAYASGVLDTVWQQFSEPYYRVVGSGSGADEAPTTVEVAGETLPAPSEGQLIPEGQNLWILRPDDRIRDVWTSATERHFVFDRPADRPRFAEIERRRDELFAGLPDRHGDATLGLWLNRASRWYPRLGVWLVVGLVALAWRRPARWPVPLALAGGATLVVLLNALGLGPDPHYALPVAPGFVLLAAAGLLGPRRSPTVRDDVGHVA